MTRYGAVEHFEDGERLVTLSDRETGSTAVIVPGVGAQCHRFTWTMDGERLDILAGAQDIPALKERPMYFGNPILFPFPNRVKDGVFRFQGKEYRLPVNEVDRGHALHGLVFTRPWKLKEYGAGDDTGAWVTCRFVSGDFPEVEEVFPFPFAVEYTYRLRDGRLENQLTAENTGEVPMPMGFGVHPWFLAPLSAKGSRGSVRLKAPTSRIWALDDRLIPTGEVVPALPERDLSKGIDLGDHFFDDVYAGLNETLETDGWSEAAYVDPGTGVEVAVRSEPSFRELVIYAPLDRNIVCIEPYTCATDAFNLQERGIDAGRIDLEPGETWTGRIDYVPRKHIKAQ